MTMIVIEKEVFGAATVWLKDALRLAEAGEKSDVERALKEARRNYRMSLRERLLGGAFKRVSKEIRRYAYQQEFRKLVNFARRHLREGEFTEALNWARRVAEAATDYHLDLSYEEEAKNLICEIQQRAVAG
ncbi:MAG: hypothetical protein FJ044_03535 [Candidatus Cloacimonetes bacterium]|nr:hypothetical protein [Candidatus Cloacimonadota bacterium]